LGNLPRNVVPLAKVEAYSYPLIGIIPRLWAVIPVRRGEVDRQALSMARAVLAAGEVILIAPEGTRSPRGGRKVALLAEARRKPVVPIALGRDQFPTTALESEADRAPDSDQQTTASSRLPQESGSKS
jgi:1-acyl-sn-glycerol-3-phosphate acyltransferase